MKKIVIIGAGPAGITSGLELLRNHKEQEVIILEESTTVGGISRTVNHNGNRIDIGGHRFFSKDPKVNKWWNDILPLQGYPSYDDIALGRDLNWDSKGPNPEKTDKVMLKRNRVSRIYYDNKFFDYPVKMNWNTVKNMGVNTTIWAGSSYIKSTIIKKSETSLENFYINRFGKKLYSMFFEGYTEKLWGRHPRDISADWGAQRVKGLSIRAIIKDIFYKMLSNKGNRNVETSLIEEFSYPKFGPGQLWETAAMEFEKLGGKIIYGAKVIGITTSEDDVRKVIYELNNNTEQIDDIDAVFSSMPLKDLVEGMNDVPLNVQRIASGLPYRDFVTVGLLFNKINLKNKTKLKTLSNIVPDCWIYVQDVGVKLGRIQIFNNWSCYMVEKPEDTIWLGLEYFCYENDEYWNMSEEKWRDFGKSELIKMGIIDENDNILDYHCEKVKKAYPAYFDTYYEIDEVIDYLNGFDNLYCIGRNGQHRYNNMDHSMVTAFEAVNNYLNGVKCKDNIWSVNTDQDYHEEKKNA